MERTDAEALAAAPTDVGAGAAALAATVAAPRFPELSPAAGPVGPRTAAAAGASPRGGFHLGIALAMAATVLGGFWFTYLGPLAGGRYPRVSPLVHLHGGSFFAWYGLLVVQSALVRARRVGLHRTLGLASTALGALMIVTGLIVTTVRIALAAGPPGDPFWSLMGLPIFAVWALFTVFYVAAIARRRRPGEHRRLIVLASAAGLSAATFRLAVRLLGPAPWVAAAGTLAPCAFVVASIVRDLAGGRRPHRVDLWGLAAMAGLVGSAFLLPATPAGEPVMQAVAWIGRRLMPLY